MKRNKIKILALVFGLITLSSCLNDLDKEPVYDLTLERLLEQDPNAIEGLMSKMYSNLALTSSNGPGESDITANDKGETGLLRSIINLEDLTADGVKNRWNDDGLEQLTTTKNWDQNNKFSKYLFERTYLIIPQTNNLINIVKNNSSISNKDNYIGELRFLRALAYYYIIDCFGKGVLATDQNYGTSGALPEVNRTQLFNYVESELLDIEKTIPVKNNYGRANKSAVRMLLAKLYLNSRVYTGTARFDKAAELCKKVIDEGGYSLEDNFVKNFSSDNNTSKEIIFPVISDALTSQSYSNTTYLINGSLFNTTMKVQDYGMRGDGWGGHRATKAWYGLFGSNESALASSPDVRSKLFWTTGHSWEMADVKTWTNGYPSIKFRNFPTDGTATTTYDFSNTDFPLFRLADTYLMYAECVLRGAPDIGTSKGNALQLVNLVRRRAKALEVTSINLDFILDERARELNFEGMRRQDLIRFDKFTGGGYTWPWKGGVATGSSIPSYYNVFPLPISALQANPNLKQNPGYN